MIAICFAIFLVAVGHVAADDGGILQIHYPNISIEADNNGNITLQSGSDASVYMIPGPGGTVYFDGEDLLRLVKVINGLPPVWKDHSSVGFFKTAFGGDTVDVLLQALDPENRPIQYTLVAGTMPPGLRIDGINSKITGRVPDVDAIYSFTVRATNSYDKYADAVFRMEIIERNQCLFSSPCQNGGSCVDQTGSVPYTCACTADYSGVDCEIPCMSQSLGVNDSSIIPDAMMSAYLSEDNYTASEGRLNGAGGSGKGWCGANGNSWLQVDLGNVARIYTAVEQSYDTTYYTGSYRVSYSTDGTTFQYVTAAPASSGNASTTPVTYTSASTPPATTVPSTTTTASSASIYIFTGSSSTAISNVTLPTPIDARFVRFHPVSYSSSNFPCMRVDLLGCYLAN